MPGQIFEFLAFTLPDGLAFRGVRFADFSQVCVVAGVKESAKGLQAFNLPGLRLDERVGHGRSSGSVVVTRRNRARLAPPRSASSRTAREASSRPAESWSRSETTTGSEMALSMESNSSMGSAI